MWRGVDESICHYLWKQIYMILEGNLYVFETYCNLYKGIYIFVDHNKYLFCLKQLYSRWKQSCGTLDDWKQTSGLKQNFLDGNDLMSA
jgi:hypothetical protein